MTATEKIGMTNMAAEKDADARLRTVANGNGSAPTLDDKSSIGQTTLCSEDKLELRRTVGLVGGVSLIVGTMIGSGIFISPKGVLRGSGSVALSLILWAACGALSMLGALCYAELGTLITKSGGEYAYLMDAFAPMGRWGEVPGFLLSWTRTIVIVPSSTAVICLACARYAVVPFFTNCSPPDSIEKILATFIILIILVINCYSADLATKVQIIFTVAKLAAIALIVVGGIVMLFRGNTQYLSEGFKDTTTNPGTIAIAFYNGLWSYDGWNNLNYVTEEIKDPYKNLPRAIIIALPLVTLCYVAVNVSYFTLMSKEELLASGAVAVLWADRILGAAAFLIPVSVALSTFGAANGTTFTGGRLCFVAAREGHMVSILSMVHVKRYTPLPSLIFSSLIAILMIIPGNIDSLIDFFSFTAWLFYGMTMAALLVMRYTKKDDHRPYKVPIAVPIIVLIASVYLVIAPIIDNPRIEFLFAFLFVLAGLVFYIPFVHYKIYPKFMDKFTMFLQLVLECSPSDYEPDM